MKIPDTLSQVLNAPSHVTNTPSQCRRSQVRRPKQQRRQPKQQVRPILIYAVLSQCNFCRKFTHFSGIQSTGQKMRWRTKNDKYEVCSLFSILGTDVTIIIKITNIRTIDLPTNIMMVYCSRLVLGSPPPPSKVSLAWCRPSEL